MSVTKQAIRRRKQASLRRTKARKFALNRGKIK